jgi:pimeloyl-ACP methyl ester carboxylesterase
MSDSYLEPAWADRLAARLPAATTHIVPDAGHWPWQGDPGAIAAICDFLETGAVFPAGTSH